MARPRQGLQGPRQAIRDGNVEGIDSDPTANARIACERPGDVEVEAEDCPRQRTLHELGVLTPDANVARKAACWIEPDRTARRDRPAIARCGGGAFDRCSVALRDETDANGIKADAEDRVLEGAIRERDRAVGLRLRRGA